MIFDHPSTYLYSNPRPVAQQHQASSQLLFAPLHHLQNQPNTITRRRSRSPTTPAPMVGSSEGAVWSPFPTTTTRTTRTPQTPVQHTNRHDSAYASSNLNWEEDSKVSAHLLRKTEMLGIKNRVFIHTGTQQQLHVLVAHVSCGFKGNTARGIKTGTSVAVITRTRPRPRAGPIKTGTTTVPATTTTTTTTTKTTKTTAAAGSGTGPGALKANSTSTATKKKTTINTAKGSGPVKACLASGITPLLSPLAIHAPDPFTFTSAPVVTVSTPTRSTTKKLTSSSSRQERKKTTKRVSTTSAVREVMTLSSASSLRPATDPSMVMMPLTFSTATIPSPIIQDLNRVAFSAAKISTSGRVNRTDESNKTVTKIVDLGTKKRWSSIKNQVAEKSAYGTWTSKVTPVSTSSRSLLNKTPRLQPPEVPNPPVALELSAATTGKPVAPLPFLDFRTKGSREVMYTKSEEEADQWLSKNRTRMWALDAEWKPFAGYRQQGKIALIQLGDDKTVYLFHVIHMRCFPMELARILEDKRILKVGINIKGDGSKIYKDWGVACASMVELGAISIQVQDDLISKRKVRSMDTLTRELLGHSVEKVELTRMGNWESRNLSANQIAYAANDVFVTYEIAERLKGLQRLLPERRFTLPLATVHKEGSTTLQVQGTLLERQNRAATAMDVVDTSETKNLVVPGSRDNDRWRPSWMVTTISNASWASKAVARTVLEPFRFGVRQSGGSPPSSTKSVDATSSTATSKKSTRNPDFFSKNGTDKIRTMTTNGGKTVVTIIPAKLQRSRLFCTLSRSNLFVATGFTFRKSVISSSPATTTASVQPTEETKRSRSTSDIYFPSQLLPESLEGKDILERNQTVWLEAGGGRDLSEDESGGEQDDDWHLNQNQALFASLVSHPTPLPDGDADGGDGKK